MEALTVTVKMPPLIRAAQLAIDELGAIHVDNFTGCIIHDKKVERAIARAGLRLDEQAEVEGESTAILIRRRRGGQPLLPVLLDITTAGMLLAVWDGLNDANKARMPAVIARLGASGFVVRMWKFCK
jgi:hypothetical protein